MKARRVSEVMAFVSVTLVLVGCGSGAAASPTPLPIPTQVNTPVPTDTPAPTPVPPGVLVISPEAMEIVRAWGSTIEVYTRADAPVTSLLGLGGEEVGIWNNSHLGMDLIREAQKLFEALGEPRTSFHLFPRANSVFEEESAIRVYFTDDSPEGRVSSGSGIKIVFQSP